MSTKKKTTKNPLPNNPLQWIDTNINDINIGDLVRTITVTNSQKYLDYNKTRIGYLTKKKKNLCNCEIKTLSNKKKNYV